MEKLKPGDARITVTAPEDEFKILGEVIMLFLALPDAKSKKRVLNYLQSRFIEEHIASAKTPD